MIATFMNAFYEAFVYALKKPWVISHPSWNTLLLLNQLVFKFGKCGSLERKRSCMHWPRISQGWPIEDGSGPGRPVKGV